MSFEPYDADYVLKVPYMDCEDYKDSEFEMDEKLFWTALLGDFELKKDGFHRLIAKLAIHLPYEILHPIYDESKINESIIRESIMPQFTSSVKLSNQISLNDLFVDEINEDQLICFPLIEDELGHQDGRFDFLNTKKIISISISIFLLRLKTKSPKNLKEKYKNLFSITEQIYSSTLICRQSEKLKINFNKFERIIKSPSDALNFAICYMILYKEKCLTSNLASRRQLLYQNCFLLSSVHYGLSLWVHYFDMKESFLREETSENKFSTELLKTIEAFEDIEQSRQNLSKFFREIEDDSSNIRWRWARIVNPNFFNYMGLNLNMKMCLVAMFYAKLNYGHLDYDNLVKARKNDPNFKDLSQEEKITFENTYKEAMKQLKLRRKAFVDARFKERMHLFEKK